MAQADLNVANQSGSAFRADLNNQLLALGTLMSGASEPSTTYAYMLWADTANALLKQRNAANNAWITLRNLDGSYARGTAGSPSVAFDGGTGIYSLGEDQVAIATAGTGRLFIDDGGRVMVGVSTALTNAYAIGTALTPVVQIQGNTANGAALSITRQTSAAANLLLQRGVTGTPVADTEAVGQISFNGFNGTSYYNAALICGVVDGTPGTGSMPGRLSFQTTPSGSTTPVERLQLDPAGQIFAASLGTAALPVWSFTGDPNTGIWSPAADTLAVSTNGSEVVRFTSDAYLRMAASTGGIQFNGDTAAANALDDYEEGTFTPGIQGSSTAGTSSYGSRVGHYTKIGRQVFFTIYIVWSSGTGTGNLQITGLPFATNSALNDQILATASYIDAITLPANTCLGFGTTAGATTITAYSTSTAGGSTTTAGLAYDAAGTLEINGVYYV